MGTAGVPNYFRKPYGPGWALVGDAGYDKDPITAQGISDAFIDAENLTQSAGRRLLGAARGSRTRWPSISPAAIERVKPMYDFTCQLATLEPPPPPMRELFAALHGNQEATNQFYSALTGSLPLPEFMNPENIGRIIGGAANAV